jgi:hypothetical protein
MGLGFIKLIHKIENSQNRESQNRVLTVYFNKKSYKRYKSGYEF